MKSKPKWTVFFNANCYDKNKHSPFDYIAVQAPRGRAEDVMRNGFKEDPHIVNCAQHGGGWWATEDVEDPSIYVGFSSNNSIMVVRDDAVPYYEKGIWVHRTKEE